jgi:hypothetical protein
MSNISENLFLEVSILEYVIWGLVVFDFLTLGWALYLYSTVRNKEFKTKDPYNFNELANLHKNWAQVWFTISFMLFIAALCFGLSNILVELKLENQPPETMTSFLYRFLKPAGYIYLFLLMTWVWAIKNYSAHWHNFICNEHRYGALKELKKLRDEITNRVQYPATKVSNSSSNQLSPLELRQIQEFQRNLDKRAAETTLMLIEISGLLMMLPSESAYFDKKVDEGVLNKIANFGSGISDAVKHSS